MIIDTFSYFNEEILLELRIKLLIDKVDLFIICDGNRTHSGITKPFTCEDTIKRLNLSSQKIKVLNVDLSKFRMDESWYRERFQRDAAKQYIGPDDVCFVSDCDEMIDPKVIDYYIKIHNDNPQSILRIPLISLYYKADITDSTLQSNAYISNGKQIKDYSLSQIRESASLRINSLRYPDIYITENNRILESGWHFSWMGSNSDRLRKYRSFMHYNDTTNHNNVPNDIFTDNIILNKGALINNMQPLGQSLTEHHIMSYDLISNNNVDILGRNSNFTKYDISKLPQQIFDNKHIELFLLPPG